MNMDGLTNLMFCIMCYSISKAYNEDSSRWHIFAGFSFGLAMLTKWTLALIPLAYVFLYGYNEIAINHKSKKLVLMCLLTYITFVGSPSFSSLVKNIEIEIFTETSIISVDDWKLFLVIPI